MKVVVKRQKPPNAHGSAKRSLASVACSIAAMKAKKFYTSLRLRAGAFNFLWAGLIHIAFPQATIIHSRRAAVDTALSIHQTHFHPTLAFPTGGAELVAYFRSYQRLMDHWRSVLPADRFLEVDYAELTRSPEAVIRRIIAACGLAWDDACLRPELNPRAVKTPSKWQTRQPIYRTSVERWRRYEPWLGPLRALVDEGPKPDAGFARS